GSKMTRSEWTEQEIGTAIEFNDTLLTTQSLIVHGNDDSILMYYNKSNDYFKITGTSATSAGQYLSGSLAGEIVVQYTEEETVFTSKDDHNALREEVTEVKESIAENSNPNPLYGKKLVGIGDSMMQGHSISKANGWLAKIADRNGMTYVNYGINGTYMTNKLYGTSEGVVDRYSEMDDDADYILIFAGTNDISASVTIGDEDSTDESEFYGALNSICQGLMSKYPNGKIGFITPHVRSKSARTKTLSYIEAIETACQNNGGIPVFNNAKNGGLCYWNSEQAAQLTLGDNCHYSAEGMEWFSWKYEAFLRSL
ncbi:MAG: SGNH/GDSL hydrolase family protein, partial [Lachnospiraceae bacterium]|nr:SGNH/GDSL hydrolase family protein [Lachnospiraceae bacterium]